MCVPASEEENNEYGVNERLMELDPQKLTEEQYVNGVDLGEGEPLKYVVLCECSGARLSTPKEAVDRWHNG
jgi:hypothetical protein